MLTFKEDGHQYFWNDTEVISPTKVIKEFGFINSDYIDPVYALRGKCVHLATEYYDLGCLDKESIDENVLPYLESYIQFKDDMGNRYKIIDVEKMFYNMNKNYACCIDRVCKIDGRKSVLDIKTGEPPVRYAELQLSAYDDCIPNCEDRYILKLNKTANKKGKRYKLKFIPDRKDMWYKCLDVYNYKKENRRK